MGRLTTHVLDTTHGCPGAGIRVRLYSESAGEGRLLLVWEGVTNADGRCAEPLLSGERMKKGIHQLAFEVGAYFRAKGVASPDPAFLETVRISFGIADADAHYHVPLLVSPYGYSTYRGS